MSIKPRAPTRRALLSLALCTMLSACLTPTVPKPTAPPCMVILRATGLLRPTPGATRPADDTVGAIAAFGVRQTGQLDKANADKTDAAAMLDTCDSTWRAALEGKK